MSSTVTDLAAPEPLRIEGELTIFRAAELKLQLLAQPQPVTLDLSGVTEIDSSGLQLLLMARQVARARQGELRVLQPSAAVTELFALLNVAALFAEQPSGVPA